MSFISPCAIWWVASNLAANDSCQEPQLAPNRALNSWLAEMSHLKNEDLETGEFQILILPPRLTSRSTRAQSWVAAIML